MSTDDLNPSCIEFQTELMRLACDESAERTDGLRAHLTACAACRTELDASREFLGALQDALRPEPLPAGLAERIRVDVNTAKHRRTRLRLWLVRAGIAAAAAAIGLMLIPRALRSGSGLETWAPSAQDAATIAQAYGLLAWDSPEDSMAYIETQLQRMAETLEGGADRAGDLPWGVGDDWDVPTVEADSSVVPAARVSRVASRTAMIRGRA